MEGDSLDLLQEGAVLYDLDQGWDGCISQLVVGQVQSLQGAAGPQCGTQGPGAGVRQLRHFNANVYVTDIKRQLVSVTAARCV